MYRYACWDKTTKTIKLFTWDEDGNRVIRDCPFNPYLYYEDQRGHYKSIFGTPLTKKEFKTPFDRKKFIEDSHLKRLFENIKPAQQFLIDEYYPYYGSDDFTKNPLKICFWDIETEPLPSGEFPLQEENGTEVGFMNRGSSNLVAKAPISLITIHNSLTNKYTTFGTKPFTGEFEEELDCEYIYCKTEAILLENFLRYLEEDHPDILSAWNGNFFDNVYLVDRIKRVIGEEHLTRLSPIGKFWISEGKTKDNPPRTYTKYNTDGMLMIDYMDVYKKFKVKLLDTYRLDYIGLIEVGRQKLEYEGSINDFQKNDWNKFVLYNIRDVELLVKIDQKTNYFSLFRLLATFGLTNFEDSLGVVAYNVGALAILARQKGKVLYTPKRDVLEGKNEGGYVSVKPGLTSDLFTLDFSSLYPNIVRTLNISPETMIGEIIELENNECLLTLVSGKQFRMTKEKLDRFIKTKNFIKSSANILFTQDYEGIVPEQMRIVFTKRKQARKLIAKKEEQLGEVATKLLSDSNNVDLIKEKQQLIDDIKRLDALQYCLKLSINSLYGCLTSKTSPIGDDRLGNSVTLSGQESIKEVNRFVQEYIKKHYAPDLTDEEKEAVVQFNDTDSCGITLKSLVKRGYVICKDQKVTEQGFKIVNDISNAVNQNVIDYSKNHFFTNNCTLDLKLEKICDFGLYRKKKNYILHVIFNEGKIDPKTGEYEIEWVYKGVELAKAIMTKEIKDIAKKVIEPMIIRQDKLETDRLLQEAYEQFKKLPFHIICKLARVKTFNKYVKECDMFNTAKSMLQHVKAAYYHNLLLKLLDIKDVQEIMQGDTVQILPVKTNNKYRISCVAFKDNIIPEQFLEIFEPDYKEIFSKPFFACIQSLYEIAGWECPMVTDEYEGDLFDIF